MTDGYSWGSLTPQVVISLVGNNTGSCPHPHLTSELNKFKCRNVDFHLKCHRSLWFINIPLPNLHSKFCNTVVRPWRYTDPKSQHRLKWLLSDGSTAGLVVSKALIPKL